MATTEDSCSMGEVMGQWCSDAMDEYVALFVIGA